MTLKGGLEGREFNYGEILAIPDRLTDFVIGDISLKTRLSRNIPLNIPLLSAPMDTVTEAEMAIAIALQGGLGVIHYNMTAEKQAEEAERVKRFQNGFIENPTIVSPDSYINEVANIRKTKGISTIPVTEGKKQNGRLVGIITKDDYSLLKHENLKVAQRMTPLSDLETAVWPTTLEEANDILLESHRGTLPIIDKEGNLMYLVTRSDIEKNESFPNANKDKNKRLRVAIAIESKLEKALKRAEVADKFVDAYVIDTSHAYGAFIPEIIKEIHRKYGKDVIVGNVSTSEATEFLIENGADAVKVGTGPGSICTTKNQTGTGREQGSAVDRCVIKARKLINKFGYIPIIADGGVKEPGDFLKALALGADSVMVGSMLAGTKETPGEIEQKDGKLVKEYRGMGSEKSMKKGSAIRYSVDEIKMRAPEGIVKKIEYKGPVSEIVPRYIAALKQGMQKVGCKTIKELHKHATLVPNKYVQEQYGHETVIGGLWGDEGKGKLIDLLSEKADFIGRVQGGDNAGHTIKIGEEEIILHLIPSGILHKGKKNIIANGVVVNPDTLLREISELKEKGIEVSPSNLNISGLANLILPYHILEDIVNEYGSGIGTTLKGIGPAYKDKIQRKGINFFDLIELSQRDLETMVTTRSKEAIDYALWKDFSASNISDWINAKDTRKKMLKHFLEKDYFSEKDFLDNEKILDNLLDSKEKLKDYVTDTAAILEKAHLDGKKILFEGAQGTLLDICFGTYPYVTSSNTTIGGIYTGTGVGIPVTNRYLIFKAFSTRVGGGPFPTEIQGGVADLISDKTEFGATTGRKRRIGWFDAVLANYSIRVNSANKLAITKIDRLDELNEIKICTSYMIDNKKVDRIIPLARKLEQCTPIYETLPGWKCSTVGITNYKDLPKNAANYIERIEELTGIPVKIIGTGQERSQAIVR